MYYIEFVEPVEGVSLERFRQVLQQSADDWAREHPDDELVLNLGRTWRMGPRNARYLTIWKIEDFSVFERWKEEFAKPEVAKEYTELQKVYRIVDAGVYEDLGREIV